MNKCFRLVISSTFDLDVEQNRNVGMTKASRLEMRTLSFFIVGVSVDVPIIQQELQDLLNSLKNIYK